MTIRVLAVSDQIDPRIYSATLRSRMPDVQLVFGCGDLPARYLEFLADALEKPVYFVLGNHMEEWTKNHVSGRAYDPMGCCNLDGRVVRERSTGVIVGGLPGSPKYSGEGGQQFSEYQMAWKMLRMVPGMARNRVRRGRWIDVLISHAPPRGINDGADVAHRGFKVMPWFLRFFKPTYHLHGHIHLYDRNVSNATTFSDVHVVNVYPYQKLDLRIPLLDSP
ncbi:metallophosphoesterase [soil metagenome]